MLAAKMSLRLSSEQFVHVCLDCAAGTEESSTSEVQRLHKFCAMLQCYNATMLQTTGCLSCYVFVVCSIVCLSVHLLVFFILHLQLILDFLTRASKDAYKMSN